MSFFVRFSLFIMVLIQLAFVSMATSFAQQGVATSIKVRALALSPGGKMALLASGDHSISGLDPIGKNFLYQTGGHSQRIWSLAFSADGKRFVSASEDKTIKIWNAESGALLHTLRGHTDWVWSAAFSPDGQSVVSGSADGTVRIWSAQTGQLKRRFRASDSNVTRISFSPDGLRILAGGSDGMIRQWDVRSGIQLRSFRAEQGWIWSLAYSPDGRYIATGGSGGVLKLWDATTGAQIRRFVGHGKIISALSFSPDGQVLLSGSGDKTAKLWDIRTGRLMFTLRGHKTQLLYVGFSASGKGLFSASDDGILKAWRAANGRLVATFRLGAIQPEVQDDAGAEPEAESAPYESYELVPPPTIAPRAPVASPRLRKPKRSLKRGYRAEEQMAEVPYNAVRILFGTDRNNRGTQSKPDFSGQRSANRLALGSAEVTIPKNHVKGQVERPLNIAIFSINIYKQKEDPKKHFTLQKMQLLNRDEFAALSRDIIAKQDAKGASLFPKQAFVFIHGYNTTFENAMYRSAQMSYDLKFDGVTFMYSWPSAGKLESYVADQRMADNSRRYLKQFLQVVAQDTGVETIHIIAHSMGNRATLKALKLLAEEVSAGIAEKPKINQIILAAPDVDRNRFVTLTGAIRSLARHITLYASGKDLALIASGKFAGASRAGAVPPEGPVIAQGVDTIDITAVDTDWFSLNHSSFAERSQLVTDVQRLLMKGQSPKQRSPKIMVSRSVPKGLYWLLQKLQ